MERLPRVLPFWMMLLGIVGFFILGVLYFDVRGREARSPAPPVSRKIEDTQTQPESSETTSTPEVLGVETEADMPLALPVQNPTTQVPAIAVYDCWTFEQKGDRIVVGPHAWDFASDQVIPFVTDATLHLSCQQRQTWIIRDTETNNTFMATAGVRDEGLLGIFDPGTLYRIDPYTGMTDIISSETHPEDTPPTGYISLTPDKKNLDMMWHNLGHAPQGPQPTEPDARLVRVSLDTGKTRSFSAPNVRDPISVNPSHTVGIGIEWTCYKSACTTYPAFLHRLNLETGKTIRVGEVFDWDRGVDPIFIDDEHVVVVGEITPAFVMNIYTRATAPIRQITSSLDRLAITTDGKNIVVTGPDQPLTVIPVSELPKP